MNIYATNNVTFLCLASLLLVLSNTVYAEEPVLWYASDASGMAFDIIKGPQDSVYALRLSKTGAAERSELFHDGVVTKSWHRSYQGDGILIREAYSEGDMLTEERLFDLMGRPSIERLFLEKGIVEEIHYQYASGRLQSKTTSRSGEAATSLVYLYAPDGRLALAKDSRDLSFGTSSAPSGEQAVWRKGQDGLELRRYDSNGRLKSVSVYADDVLQSQESREWKDGLLAGSIFETIGGTKTTTHYSLEGVAIGQETSVTIEFDRNIQTRINKSYDDKGRLERLETRALDHVRLLIYEYDEDGTLHSTKTFVDGLIESLISYESALVRIEQLYSRGAAFVRVRYEDGRRVLEEMLKDGEVVRTRRFE